MTTDIEICNMALFHAKHSQFIQSFDESGVAAKTCKLFYAQVRDQLLGEYPWLFAQAQDYMALSGEAPLGWAYQYELPNNCIQPLYIKNNISDDPKFKIPFEKRLSSDKSSTVIVTNEPTASLVYTYKITNETLFPAYFISAFAYLLASHLSMPLTKGEKVTADLRRLYEFELSKAKAKDALAFHKEKDETASWHDARN